jgi:hypothetical protein
MAIVDKQPLGKTVNKLCRPAGTVVSLGLANGVGQLSARRGVSEEDIGESVAALLSGKAGPDNRDHVRLSKNGLKKNRTNTVDDHDGGPVCPRNCLDESIAVVPWIEIVAVPDVVFDGDVPIFVR